VPLHALLTSVNKSWQLPVGTEGRLVPISVSSLLFFCLVGFFFECPKSDGSIEGPHGQLPEIWSKPVAANSRASLDDLFVSAHMQMTDRRTTEILIHLASSTAHMRSGDKEGSFSRWVIPKSRNCAMIAGSVSEFAGLIKFVSSKFLKDLKTMPILIKKLKNC